MTKNEIKKALYREKPIAHKGVKGTEYVWFHTILKNDRVFHFQIPSKEATGFNKEEPAQLLIRWLVV